MAIRKIVARSIGVDVIVAEDIAANAITAAEISSGAVTTAKLATDLVVTHGLGSASTPSITFTGDTNTGIFSPTADTIAFSEGGTEAMRIDSSGNVGIGTASPNSRLTIVGSADLSADINSTSANGGYMVWRTSGTVIADLGTAQNCFGTGGTDTFAINGRGARALLLGTNNTERMRIDSSGNLLVGATTALVSASTGRLNVQATTGVSAIYASSSSSFANAVVQIGCGTNSGTGWSILEGYSANSGGDQFAVTRFKVLGNGNVQNTNNSYGALSDVKLKENITDATPKLEKLNQVRVVNYNLIGNETKQLGVIAQELEQVFPSMVDETPDRDSEGNDLGTTTKAVKYSVFVPMLIKAIQEQQVIIDALKARLDAAGL
jgi:hypothetical protein